MAGSLSYVCMDGWKSPRLAQKTYGESNIEELWQCLVYISLELESTREAAKLQNKINEAKVLQLQSLLERVRQERDEAHHECKKLQECRLQLSQRLPYTDHYERICFKDDDSVRNYQESRQARHGDALSPSLTGDECSQLAFGSSEISCEDTSFNLDGPEAEALIHYAWNGETSVDLEWGKASSTSQSIWNHLDPIPIQGNRNSNVSVTVAPKPSVLLPSPSLPSLDLFLATTRGAWHDSPYGLSKTPSYQKTLKRSLDSNYLYYHQPPILVNQTYQYSSNLPYELHIPANQVYLLDMLDPKKNVAHLPLPEKGNLLQAVMHSGPLLQTILLAGAVPEWNHPPQLNRKDVLNTPIRP